MASKFNAEKQLQRTPFCFCPKCHYKLFFPFEADYVTCASCEIVFAPQSPFRISCLSCQTPFVVPHGAKFISCPFCNSFLAFRETKINENQFIENLQPSNRILSYPSNKPNLFEGNKKYLSFLKSGKRKSPFMVFCDLNRPVVNSEFSGLSFGETTAKLTKMWSEMSSSARSSYNRKAEGKF